MDLANETETGALAARLAKLVKPGDFIALAGDLGAGKTVFARAFIGALAGTAKEVPSPTFTLIQTYDLGVITVHHVDLYRLKTPEEALELGLDEALSNGVIVMEWPERLGRYLPGERLEVAMEFGTKERQRRVAFSGGGDWPERLRKAGIK
ncbi:MAG TPA: tRNA (adenosine(37)-N6)-threonylcarbamoyltransferase complex ATPase subunit type 1 TsaE [Alphaproteobacteria bacterium]|nr:tRNA (adenosine(37)-N6)-threonylcarbamoyltransferase complex ATPase subunit type 1 TsaE [Alphaproteobacteria bacterium]